MFSPGKPSEATSQTSEQQDVSKYRPRNRRFASGDTGSGEGDCPAGSAVGSAHQGHSGGENCHTSGSDRGDEAREWAPTSAVRMNHRPRRRAVLMAKMNSVTHCTNQPKNSPTAPLDGWRCDLCGEIVTAQERPLLPPEICPRCSSVYITSIEPWAARPVLGLWTR